MSIANKNTYNFEAKEQWRTWVRSQMLERSFAVKDNKLLGKWLEPVGVNAESFASHLTSAVITAPQLIGIDCDPSNTTRSKQNIDKCRKLFPESTFQCKTWSDFCYSSKGTDIRYMVYDLFTSTHGQELILNLTACFALIGKALRSTDQVLLVINADLRAMHRHNKTLGMFGKKLTSMIRDHSHLPNPLVDIENMYTYQNTTTSSKMGSLVLDFH